VHVYLGSVAEIDYLIESYDLILDIGCYHSLSAAERDQYRAHVLRLLAPGGTFMLYGFLDRGEGRAAMREEEIDLFAHDLNLVSRQDGQDHGKRPSVWLRFER
jgi:cyclopropane fatty-acyl-phospholipid synthase-like methyltransferase